MIPSPSERFRGWIHLGFFQSIACGVYMYVWSIYPLLIGNLEDILGKTIGNLEYFFSMNLYLSWKLCQVLSHKLSFDDWRIWTPDLCYDRHEFDYDDMVPGRLPISVIEWRLEHTLIRVRSAFFIIYWYLSGHDSEQSTYVLPILHAVDPNPVAFFHYLRI